MTTSQNPLDKLGNFTVKYVLCAFAYTEDACKTTVDGSVGQIGTQFSGSACGKPAVVIINDFKKNPSPYSFRISRYESDFSYFGSLSPSTTQMLGMLAINDDQGGYFPTFLRNVVKQLGGVSETHVAFVLRTFFVGYSDDGSQSQQSEVDNTVVTTNPLIFTMVTLSQSLADFHSHEYTMFFSALYNTTAQFPGFSRLYQTTITNQNNNPSQDIPKPDVPGSTILKRGIEDALKRDPRQTRIDKSETMQTLKDVFEGMAADLMQQKYAHKRQLQEWLSYVRDDYVKKIEVPKLKKPPGQLPIDYRLILDGALESYQVDNRNMPFEQPEQSQLSNGIRVLNIAEGESLPKMFDKIMKLSTQVTKDILDGKGYKTTFILLRRCEGKYDLFMKIKQITIPYNSPDKDTGPDAGPNPLEFTFNAPGTSDADSQVMTLQGKLNSNIFLNMMEQQIDDPDAKVVYGNREQATAERNANLDFFKTFFSGVMMNVNNENNSLQFADFAGGFDNYMNPYINGQSNVFTMPIKGNSDLLSDISRNPFWVYQDNSDNAKLYEYPEYNPMYAKVKIYLDTGIDESDKDGDRPASDPYYYYTNFYHLYRIKTIIDGNDFMQELGLLRTDDIS